MLRGGLANLWNTHWEVHVHDGLWETLRRRWPHRMATCWRFERWPAGSVVAVVFRLLCFSKCWLPCDFSGKISFLCQRPAGDWQTCVGVGFEIVWRRPAARLLCGFSACLYYLIHLGLMVQETWKPVAGEGKLRDVAMWQSYLVSEFYSHGCNIFWSCCYVTPPILF